MRIARRFTTAGQDPYELVAFRSAVSEIRNPDGSVVFAAEGIEVPAEWSQVAGDILAQKYLRKAGVPTRLTLARQRGAPNSPQWFNTGLYWAYGIDGPAQGHYYVDFQTCKVRASESAYEHPQPHACFIQSVADDLVNEGGIMDLWVR